MLGKQDARREALVLAQTCGGLADEAHAARHQVVDDLGRDGDELTLEGLPAGEDLGGHADREVVGVAFRDHGVDLEVRLVHDRHDRHVARYGGLLGDEQVADDAVDG